MAILCKNLKSGDPMVWIMEQFVPLCNLNEDVLYAKRMMWGRTRLNGYARQMREPLPLICPFSFSAAAIHAEGPLKITLPNVHRRPLQDRRERRGYKSLLLRRWANTHMSLLAEKEEPNPFSIPLFSNWILFVFFPGQNKAFSITKLISWVTQLWHLPHFISFNI